MLETRVNRKAEEPIRSAPPEIRNIIKRVLDLERDNLHMERPRVREEIVLIIKDEISETPR